ncbi:MAG: ABC transporter ATP-binding protein, partial [Clostridiaceae bacterium]|nr:ABC transporter ATP-binding protein [Clostridiaceae bacterium]
MEKNKVLEIRDLSISFQTSAGEVNAIRGVKLDLYKGETLAIVGESGSGKSVTVKAIMGILSGNGKVNSGTIYYTSQNGGEEVREDLLKLSKKEMRRRINGKKIAMVFQDPMTSL